jgi:hypothetical protein
VRRVAAIATLSALLLAPRLGRANGRYPEANQLVVDPADERHLVLRATYGIVQSFDGGATWGWVCEEKIGVSAPDPRIPNQLPGIWDPPIAVTGDGTILAGLPDGLSSTGDRGCTWSPNTDVLVGHAVRDLAVDPDNPARAALVTLFETGETGRAFVAETLDHGRSWTRRGDLPEDFTPTTIEIAKGRPSRWYVSGTLPASRLGYVLRSDDAGVTWTERAFSLDLGKAPYIAAIDPSNPERVYVRVDDQTGDQLLIGNNGGDNWSAKYKATGSLPGFALSPDGTRLLLGGPFDGLLLAATTDFVFAKQSALGPRCLTWTPSRLFVCADEAKVGFSLGWAPDPAATFAPLYRTSALTMLPCASASCNGAWLALGRLLQSPDASPADATAERTVGGAVAPAEDSCNCTVPHGQVTSVSLVGLAGALAALARRCRRRLRN